MFLNILEFTVEKKKKIFRKKCIENILNIYKWCLLRSSDKYIIRGLGQGA